MFPRQGDWTETSYLVQEFDRLVEYVEGVLEFLPMPTFTHQLLVAYLHGQLLKFLGDRGRFEVFFSPIHVRTVEGRIREPDVAYITPGRLVDLSAPSNGADLVMEVVSGSQSDRARDYVEKRDEYASAGIPEYWIVDPTTISVTVLTLNKGSYTVHGEFKSGDIATSVLLPGFQINVAEAFAAAKVQK